MPARKKTNGNGANLAFEEKHSAPADKLRVLVKRILKEYGYPPDKQERATQTVLQQAELLCKD